MAFNATDYDHQGDIWYGDLVTGSVKVVYQAQQSASARIDVQSVQVIGQQLIWLEYVHAGQYVSNQVKEWLVKAMDLGTLAVRVVAHGLAPASGGLALVNEIRSDGTRIAMAESLAKGWQIQVIDLDGRVTSTIHITGEPFDIALVTDGLLFSTGTENDAGAVGHLRLWHWTPNGGSTSIGADVFQINAHGSMAAWVQDAVASQQSTGNFQAPRLFVASAPFANPQPISPVVSETGTTGIDAMACGSGVVAWWEKEAWGAAWHDVLTIWQPGWSTPVQIDTEGNESYRVSVDGGWLVWEEGFGRENPPLLERIRGVPLSVLAGEHTG